MISYSIFNNNLQCFTSLQFAYFSAEIKTYLTPMEMGYMVFKFYHTFADDNILPPQSKFRVNQMLVQSIGCPSF